jgi:hypothetical protein
MSAKFEQSNGIAFEKRSKNSRTFENYYVQIKNNMKLFYHLITLYINMYLLNWEEIDDTKC